jgi:PAS domain S-box-containing protein
MFVCDRNGNITQANGQIVRLFGAKEPQAVFNVNIFRYIEDMKMASGIPEIREGKKIGIPRISHRDTVDGSEHILSLKLFPISGSSGEVQNYIGMVEDITRQLRIEDELQDSRAQAELYVDLMGHDINNMNQIGIGFLEMAQEKVMTAGALGKDSLGFIDRPLEAFRNSSRLIGNIQKMQKIRGKETKLEPLSLGAVIAEAIEECRSVPDRQIVIEHAPVDGLTVEADGLLKDVFVNLIGNAIKHSPAEKPISIRVTTRLASLDGGDYVLIGVEDNGPGIDESRKADLFERFSPGWKKTKGKGLGLYLVRTLVESYGGHVSVEDRVPGNFTQGSRFIVQLPVRTISTVAAGQQA